MAMGTERSKALHNFTMPCGLRWGNQRFLRCMKVNSDGRISPLHRFNANSSDHHPIQQRRTTRDRDRDRERAGRDSSLEFARGSDRVGPTPPPRRFSDDDDDDGGIAATRQKVMFDLQTAADRMKDAIFKDGLEDHRRREALPFLPPPPPPPPPPPDANCPWNLRTRRAACKMPAAVGGGNDGAAGKGSPNSGFPPMRPAAAAAAAAAASLKSPIHRSDGGGPAAASGEKKERAKFSVALSKRDIEEDFYAMVGHRPPRRPKKESSDYSETIGYLVSRIVANRSLTRHVQGRRTCSVMKSFMELRVAYCTGIANSEC